MMMAVYLGLVGLAVVLFRVVPGGFVPLQDKQYLVSFAQLPDGASLDRTDAVIRRMTDIALKTPGADYTVAFPGLSINGFTNSSNAGIVFVGEAPFEKRTTPKSLRECHRRDTERKLRLHTRTPTSQCSRRRRCRASGRSAASSCEIEDRASLGYEALDQATKAFLAAAAKAPELGHLFTGYQVNVPQLYADIDRTRAQQLGVSVTDVFDTLQTYLGSLYVNDFNVFGRTYSVRVQADAKFRAHPDDIGRLKVRSASGAMVPLDAVLRVKLSAGPERAMRYNGFLSADINGAAAPGYSTGQAQAAIARVAAAALPQGFAYEWTDLTYQQILAGNSAILVFPLALLLVFLVLAAQYESLTLPLAIILIVPMGLLAAMTGVWLTRRDNNVFTQIGLIVLVGLSAKNAILIVEFARELEFAGRTPLAAAIEASRLRLRPILMTSMAFIMGVVPLVISTGAGAEMRNAMGIAVFSGMIGVTAFGLFLTPVFYVALRRLAGNRPLKQHAKSHITVVPHGLPAE